MKRPENEPEKWEGTRLNCGSGSINFTTKTSQPMAASGEAVSHAVDYLSRHGKTNWRAYAIATGLSRRGAIARLNAAVRSGHAKRIGEDSNPSFEPVEWTHAS